MVYIETSGASVMTRTNKEFYYTVIRDEAKQSANDLLRGVTAADQYVQNADSRRNCQSLKNID